MAKNEFGWEHLVLICIIILAIIALFKFIFWISIIAIIVGIIWLLINLFTQEHDYSWIPALLLVGGIILAVISYQIGYKFEESELGKPIVDSAKIIVDTDKQIKDIEKNVTNELLDATNEAIKETR